MQPCNRLMTLLLIVTTATFTIDSAPVDQHLHELCEKTHEVVATPVEHIHAHDLRALVETHHHLAEEIKCSYDLSVGKRLHLLNNLKHNLLHLLTSASDEIRTQFDIHEGVDPEGHFLAPILSAIREIEDSQTTWNKHKTKVIVGGGT